MSESSIHQVQQASRRYLVLFKVLLVAIPVLTLFYWVFINHLPEGFYSDLPVMPTQALSPFQRMLGVIVSLLPVSVVLYGLMTLTGLFRLYADGIIFSDQNVRYLQRLGYSFIVWVIATTVSTPLMSLVISMANAPGERVLVAQFGIVDIFTLIIGGIVLVIAWVMNVGRELEDDQRYTV